MMPRPSERVRGRTLNTASALLRRAKAGVTIHGVVDAAGISRAALYGEFPKRCELRRALRDDGEPRALDWHRTMRARILKGSQPYDAAGELVDRFLSGAGHAPATGASRRSAHAQRQ
jgi:AcrR family transcriptional regulator